MITVSTLFYLLIGASHVVSEPTEYESFVVLRTLSITKLDTELTGNLSPWYGAPGKDEIIVSNSCGFAEYSYSAVALEGYKGYLSEEYDEILLPEMKARGHLGEWCSLSPFLFESATLVTVGTWNNVRYILWYAEIHSDTEDSEYIVDPEFIESESLEDLLTEIKEPFEATSCWELSQLSDAELSWIQKLDDVRNSGELVCHTRGVYLDSIADAP